MDQSAFRALLATSGGNPTISKPKAKFGAAPPKRSAAPGQDASTSSKPEFKPRVQKDKSKYKKKAADDSAYRDRAAERRTGGPNDFAEAEKLLEDFKARAEGAEVDKTVLEDQMRYLGGDAEHSVLVKGLDMALLERMKHQQANESDQTLEEMEDELDRALLEKASGPKGKKTRDEMIRELKARAGGGAGAGAVEEKPEAQEEKPKKDSRFKPIAKDGWKAVGSAPATATGEKKMRKKKKVKVADPAAPSTFNSTSTSAPPPPPPSAPVEPAPKPLPLLQPTVDLDDDEFDIFGDAGEYKGLDTDSDDSDDETKAKGKGKGKERAVAAPPPPPPAAAAGGVKRSYFDDEEEDMSLTTARPAAVEGGASAGEKRRREVGSDGEEEEEERPMRLQPLSGSRLSARELLDMDDAAAKEEKRKERKAHFTMQAKDKKEAMLKAMTPEERAAHDHQVMMSYLEKQERKSKGGKDDDDRDEPEF
ncbi:hypothetical protein BCR35DRAFT_322216 [Leucosporidium creatinivorum]|uniref:RED-like N-terminal domain-containing protein n=1 Tax=Leucosporidium creatinivorum TaxID=106004 RepID=A0A1Y2EGC5_9BASI|nr:hypothetical protein BCR35DRAFT_322216 [Leucosporidium creatinivorum]